MNRRNHQKDKREQRRSEAAARLVSYEGQWSISLRHVDREADGYAWPEDGSAEEAALLGRLAPLTCHDIEHVPDFDGYKHRSQHVDGIEDSAQQRLIALELQSNQLIDTDLYRFAFGYRERLWGFFQRNVFHPLWWDPEHRVCSYDEDLAEPIAADPAAAQRAADIVTGRNRPPR